MNRRRKDGRRINGFRIFVDSSIAAVQFTTACGSQSDQPGFRGNVTDNFFPCPVGRGVKIDPGDESVPRLRIQTYAVMVVAKNLYQFTRVSVEIPGGVASVRRFPAWVCGRIDATPRTTG